MLDTRNAIGRNMKHCRSGFLYSERFALGVVNAFEVFFYEVGDVRKVIRRAIHFQTLNSYLHFDKVNREATSGALREFSAPGSIQTLPMESTGETKKNDGGGKPKHKIEDNKKGLAAGKKYLSGAMVEASRI